MKITVERIPGNDQTFAEWAAANELAMEVHERGGCPAGDPVRFYAHFHRTDVIEGIFLVGVYGNGETPETAIRDYHWKLMGKPISVGDGITGRREIQCPNEWKDS